MHWEKKKVQNEVQSVESNKLKQLKESQLKIIDLI